jgi:protein-disulfide isomerase
MKRMLAPALLILVLGSVAGAWLTRSTSASSPATRHELERLEADLDTIKIQLHQALKLLRERSPARAGLAALGPVRASIADAPSLGRPGAPVTVIEFSDYACPFCQRFFAATFPRLKQDYIDTGKIRYVFRDFPLDIHPEARKAAEAAHCAGEHGKYWEMHDVLFQNQRALAPAQLAAYAAKIGLNRRKFDQCLTSGRHSARVDRGLADGAAAGVRGTPGFVIGRAKPGHVVEGASIRGAQPLESFRRIIDSVLTVH